MSNPIDLQIQTTASDGKHTPAECVAMAKQNGVHTIAITDHDTVAGVAEAEAAGREFGIRVIPGIEISIQEHGMHLLGLGIDVENQALLAALKQAADNRLAAAREMVERFRNDGWAIEWGDVLSEAVGSSVITRPHIVGAIMKLPENKARLKGITTKHEFFQKYFTDKSPYYVRSSTITPGEAIGFVHGAGGVAVWAHPTIPEFVGNCRALETFLKELHGYGLDGLELLGPWLTEADFRCLEKLAGRYNLLVTAGSDFHESEPKSNQPWPRSAATIGDYPTFGRSLDGILPALDAAMEKQRAIVERSE